MAFRTSSVELFGRIGPLAAWELRRLARRGLALRVRLILLYTLLLTFLGFAVLWFFPLPVWSIFTAALPRLAPTEAAAFAGSFALVLLESQLVVVVVVTPTLAAAAVAEEKDRHTLPILLTTLLSDREIVFGKAAGRVAFVLAAVFTGLPVLALSLPFGGIDIAFLATGYMVTASTVALCAGLGVSAGCGAPNLRAAVVRAYGRAALFVCGAFIPPLVLATPFAILVHVHNEPNAARTLAIGFGYALAQVIVSVALLAHAAGRLRLREPGAGPPPTTEYPEPPRRADPYLDRSSQAPPPPLPPIDDANPILWKERCVGRSIPAPVFSRLVSGVAAFLAVIFFGAGVWVVVRRVEAAFDHEQAGELVRRGSAADPSGWLLVSAGVFASGRYLLPLAGAVSSAVAGERFRRTLDPLLCTPLDRRSLLGAKVHSSIERGTVFAAGAIAAVGMAFTADAGIRVGAAAAALVMGSFAFVIGLGASFTVRCASDTRAFQMLLPFAVLAIGWPVGAWNLLRREPEIPPDLLTSGMLVAAAGLATAGLVAWRHAGRRLEAGE